MVGGPSTGVTVVLLKDKTAIFKEPLCNICANKLCFTTDLSVSRPILLGFSDGVYCHRTLKTVACCGERFCNSKFGMVI